MAVVDANGITQQQFDDYVNILAAGFIRALGSDLDLAAETAQAELVAILAEVDADIDGGLVQVANGVGLSTATGTFLDDLVSQFGITRLPAARSSVTASLTGVANTIVPAGSQARTTGGDLFASIAEATIPSDVVFRAVDEGAIPVPAGSLTDIITPVLGWDGVSNALAGTIGRSVEDDVSLRDRYASVLASNALSTQEALRARVLALDGVTGCLVLENATGTALASSANRGVAMTAHSMAVVVEGGSTQAIIDVIGESKPLGIPTNGSTTGTYNEAVLRYEPVVALPVKIVMAINTDPNRFPGSGVSDIRSSIADLFAGEGEFRDAGPIGIGDSVDSNRIIGAITRIPGFTITSGPTITDTSDNALPSPVPYNRRLVIDAAAEDSNITISLT